MLLLDSSVCGLFKWRQFEPEVILLAVGWYLRFFPFVPRRGRTPCRTTTSPSGGGCSVTPQKFSVDCDRGFDRPTTVGGWMRPTSALRASGATAGGTTAVGIPEFVSYRAIAARQFGTSI